MTKNIKTQILHKSYEKKYKNKNKKRARLHASKRRPGTNFPKIVKYKCPSRSKLNRLTVLFSDGINRFQPNNVRILSHFTHCPSRNRIAYSITSIALVLYIDDQICDRRPVDWSVGHSSI